FCERMRLIEFIPNGLTAEVGDRCCSVDHHDQLATAQLCFSSGLADTIAIPTLSSKPSVTSETESDIFRIHSNHQSIVLGPLLRQTDCNDRSKDDGETNHQG